MKNCKICSSEAKSIFTEKVLTKYNADYYKCSKCGFIQLYDTFWLNEAYESAITSTDIGLLSRNYSLSNTTAVITNFFFNSTKSFLDYAGGYGVLVRLMRDKGYDFYRKDPYCENIFAKEFDCEQNNGDFELITAFEVFEHLEFPLEEIDKMLQLGKSLLFSTYLVPVTPLNSSKDWWYIMPETGQHIAFYTIEALEVIAKKYSYNLYSNRRNIHLLTPKKINNWIFKILTINRIMDFFSLLFKRDSLLEGDYQMIKNNNLR